MDLLDYIIIAVVALGGWNGYRTGLFRQITRLFGAVIAYFVSLWLKPYIAPIIQGMHIVPQQPGPLGAMLGSLSGAIAFAVVFVVSFLLLRYAAGLLDALFSLPVISTVNRLAGLVAGLILALLFVYVVTLILHYIKDPQLHRQLHNSSIVRYLDNQHWRWSPNQVTSSHQ
ncbi:MAG: CvpA family protein [Alicyclobacillus sp.]|nr:CvpA family protein [Alicyclobacillus sp.]